MRARVFSDIALRIRQIWLVGGTMGLVSLAMLGCRLADPGASGGSNSRSLVQVHVSDWSTPVLLTGTAINTQYTEQSPFMTPDEHTLYFASNRPEPGLENDGIADQNIWVSKRATRHAPWGAPTLVAALNSPGKQVDGAIYGNDLGSKITIDGLLLFFFSNRDGNNDIYVSHRSNPRDDFGWGLPVKLGDGVNTPDFENAPVYLFGQLYFARGIQMPSGLSDIYVAPVTRKGEVLKPAAPVTELNSNENDAAPSIRIDGREIFFWSQRHPEGPTRLPPDIWTSTRRSVFDKWSEPVRVGALNSPALDATCVLSFDARTMIVDSARNGSTVDPMTGTVSRDLWISTRTIELSLPHWDPWN